MKPTQDEDRLENYVEITHALARYRDLQPEGGYQRAIVHNPEAKRGKPPGYLRVEVPRKGCTFSLIETAEEYGLKVADVWQYDSHKKCDTLMLKLVEQ